MTGYAVKGNATIVSPGTGNQLEVFETKLLNRSGATLNMGICVKMANADWKLYRITAASTPDGTDITSTVQAGTTASIISTTNNDGYLVTSARPFNVIGMNIVQAETGAPTYVYSYYNGSSMSTFTPTDTIVYTSTGNVTMTMFPSIDWVVGTSSGILDSAITPAYSMRLLATAAPSQAVTINSMWVGYALAYGDTVADNAALTYPAVHSANNNAVLTLQGQEGIMPFFSTANALNMASVLYKTRG